MSCELLMHLVDYQLFKRFENSVGYSIITNSDLIAQYAITVNSNYNEVGYNELSGYNEAKSRSRGLRYNESLLHMHM